MEIVDRVKEFIDNNKTLVDNFKFKELYQKLINSIDQKYVTSTLTHLFYKMGLDPLKTLKTVPDYYYEGAKRFKLGFEINLIIPNHIKWIGKEAFSNSGVKSCVFNQSQSGLKSVGMSAFSDNSNLKQIILPDSLEIIEWYAFTDCINLEQVSIPRNIKLFPILFDGCDILKQIEYRGTMNMWKIDSERHYDKDQIFQGSNVKSIKCFDGEIKL